MEREREGEGEGEGKNNKKKSLVRGSGTEDSMHSPEEPDEHRGHPSNYFSVKTLIVLGLLTLSLLILPLILPPLPPPPSVLLLLPLGILVVLMILAFMHSDMKDMASPHL